MIQSTACVDALYITGAINLCAAANYQRCLCRPVLPKELWLFHQTVVSAAPVADKWPDKPILEREDERMGLEPLLLLLLPPTNGSTLDVPPPVTPSLNSRRKLHTHASIPSPMIPSWKGIHIKSKFGLVISTDNQIQRRFFFK